MQKRDRKSPIQKTTIFPETVFVYWVVHSFLGIQFSLWLRNFVSLFFNLKILMRIRTTFRLLFIFHVTKLLQN